MGRSLLAQYPMTPSSRSATRTVANTLFLGLGSGTGGKVPVRRRTGVWPGFAARADKERETAAVSSLCTPRSPAGVIATVAFASGLRAIVDCGLPGAALNER